MQFYHTQYWKAWHNNVNINMHRQTTWPEKKLSRNKQLCFVNMSIPINCSICIHSENMPVRNISYIECIVWLAQFMWFITSIRCSSSSPVLYEWNKFEKNTNEIDHSYSSHLTSFLELFCLTCLTVRTPYASVFTSKEITFKTITICRQDPTIVIRFINVTLDM